MRLEHNLQITNRTKDQFAKKIRGSRSQVHKYVYEGAIPGKKMMIRIFYATDRKVTPNDFFDITVEFTIDPIAQFMSWEYVEKKNVKK